MKRRIFIGLLFAPLQALSAGVWDGSGPPLSKPVEMTVHRSSSCGCCGKWIDYMRNQGFVVKDLKEPEMEAVKRRLGVPQVLESCHTAEVAGYLVEGHVPAGDVKKVLNSNAVLLGLAAPGMPAGSPGMEVGGKKDHFSVIAFDRQGNAEEFSRYGGR